MSPSTLFNSLPGMYLVQSFCHSLIAAMIADRAVKAWHIADPLARQRLRFLVILFPVISFPLYQALAPGRSSALFRLDALFDINRWLFLELWGGLPISWFVLLMFTITSLVFVFQEMLPVLRHTLEAGVAERDGERLHVGPFIEEASRALAIKEPEIILVNEDHPLLFSTTGKDAAVFVSSGLSRALTPEQLEGALAHELAHIARNRRPLLIAVFLLRIIMFFNPVVLVKFRRAVRDEEKICDDIAVSLTRNPAALAAALKMFLVPATTGERPEPDPGKLFNPKVSIEEYGHNLHLQDRIKRLEAGPEGAKEHWGVPFVFTLSAVAAINFFIV